MSEQTPVVYTEEGSVPLEEDIATAPEVIADPKMRKVAEIGNHIKQAIEDNLCDCPNRQLALRYIDLAVQASRDCTREDKNREARRVARQQAREDRRAATGRPQQG